MMWWSEYCKPEPIITVDDMYKRTKTLNIPLLSNYNAEFWANYRTNYAYFDEIFRRRYRSFAYFMQDYGSKVEDVQPEFTTAVYGVLLKNAKKYAELYRIQDIDDTEYSLLDNYNMIETMDRDTTSGNTRTHDAHTDILTHTSDAYKDEDTTEYDYAEKVTDNDRTINTGEQENTKTNTVSAYNDADYEPDNKSVDSLGEREDTDNLTVTEHSHKDTVTETIDQAEHVVTDNNAYAEYGITDAGSGTEDYTLTRRGNIGVTTATQMMESAWEAWNNIFNFYDTIFADIAKELLRL